MLLNKTHVIDSRSESFYVGWGSDLRKKVKRRGPSFLQRRSRYNIQSMVPDGVSDRTAEWSDIIPVVTA